MLNNFVKQSVGQLFEGNSPVAEYRHLVLSALTLLPMSGMLFALAGVRFWCVR